MTHTPHHISNRGANLQTLQPYLKPGRRIAVIEPGDNWPLFHGKLKYSVADLGDYSVSFRSTVMSYRKFVDEALRRPRPASRILLTFDLQMMFTLSRDVILRLNKQANFINHFTNV
jgi:hypothetical protein